METDTLISNIVTSIRALVTCPVEAYYRTNTPTKLHAMVYPVHEKAEEDMAIGNDFQTGWQVNVLIEQPWDDKVATAEAVIDTAATVKSWVNSNREYVTDYVLTLGQTTYTYIDRTGRGNYTFAVIVPLQFDPPRVG